MQIYRSEFDQKTVKIRIRDVLILISVMYNFREELFLERNHYLNDIVSKRMIKNQNYYDFLVCQNEFTKFVWETVQNALNFV